MPRAGNSNSGDIVVQGNQSPPSQTNTIVIVASILCIDHACKASIYLGVKFQKTNFKFFYL